MLDLDQIEQATDEDKQWKLDYWARLFKAETWEDLKMLAQQDNVFMETCETIYQKNQNDEARQWCETYEEAARIARTIERKHERALAQKDAIIAEDKRLLASKDAELASKDAELAELRCMLAKVNGQH